MRNRQVRRLTTTEELETHRAVQTVTATVLEQVHTLMASKASREEVTLQPLPHHLCNPFSQSTNRAQQPLFPEVWSLVTSSVQASAPNGHARKGFSLAATSPQRLLLPPL